MSYSGNRAWLCVNWMEPPCTWKASLPRRLLFIVLAALHDSMCKQVSLYKISKSQKKDTVYDVKVSLDYLYGIPPDGHKLILETEVLDDDALMGPLFNGGVVELQLLKFPTIKA